MLPLTCVFTPRKRRLVFNCLPSPLKQGWYSSINPLLHLRLHLNLPTCCHIWNMHFKCMQRDRAAASARRSYLAAPRLAVKICHPRQFVCGLWKPLLGNQESPPVSITFPMNKLSKQQFSSRRCVILYPPLYVSKLHTLPRPLHFYCLYRQAGGYWDPSGHLRGGIYPTNKCGVPHAHAVSNTFSGSLLYSECISLCASAAHCILCCITLPKAMFEVTTVLSQWKPYKKKLSIPARRPLDMPVNKHGLFQGASFLCRHLLPFPARCHVWPPSTPKMYL